MADSVEKEPSRSVESSKTDNVDKEILAAPTVEPSTTAEDVEKQQDPAPPVSDHYLTSWPLVIVMVSLCFGTLLVAIDQTIITVAIPKISTVFRALDDIGWYGSAYLLTVMAFQPTFGTIYRFFDMKIVYLISVIVFEVGSIMCAAAPSSAVFILGRAVAGLGAAGLFQGALGIVGLIVPLEKRPFYLGIVVSVFGIAVCFGPIVGGVLTDRASWRWCFWINLPIGVVVWILILIFLKLKSRDDSDRRLSLPAKLRRMDPVGTLLLIGAVCCLLLALQWGEVKHPWKSATIIGLFIGAGLLIGAFGFTQWKEGDKALVPLRVFRQRSILVGAGFLFFVQMANYMVAFYIPFYFQAVQGVSATVSGVRFIPYAVPQIVGVVVTGAIVMKTGHYVPFMILGEAMGMIGIGLLTQIDIGTPTVEWAASLVVAGLGIGIGMQMPFTATQVVLSENDIPIGNAIAVFFSQLGGAISITAGQTVLLNSLAREVPRRTTAVPARAVFDAGASNLRALTTSPVVLRALREAYATGIANTMIVSVATLGVGLLLAFGMEWLNVKKVVAAKKTKDLAETTTPPASQETPSATAVAKEGVPS